MKAKDRDDLLDALGMRFARNTHRHPDIAWDDVRARLETNRTALAALGRMESTGGEPDVVPWRGEAGEMANIT